MATIENIRKGLIEKIISIQNKELLEALDTLVSADKSVSDRSLTEEQKSMLQMSENDIASGQLISQEAMDKRNLEWLNEK
ncbi:MAG: hypothetical protein ACQES0_10370 [Bacteroidota bacterium]